MKERRDSPPASSNSKDDGPRVMFRSSTDIQQFEAPDEEELKERWYSQGEYFFIKKEAMNTVRRLCSTQGLKDNEMISSRGLEIVDSNLVKERETRIKKAIRTVLSEQASFTDDSCEEEGSSKTLPRSSCSAMIAKKYHDVTSSAELEAIEKATFDQKEAEEYLEDARQQLQKKTGVTKRLRKGLGKLFKWK